jgi:hypothetical protein
VGDFPRIRKDFKEKSSIPRCSAAGILYYRFINQLLEPGKTDRLMGQKICMKLVHFSPVFQSIAPMAPMD